VLSTSPTPDLILVPSPNEFFLMYVQRYDCDDAFACIDQFAGDIFMQLMCQTHW